MISKLIAKVRRWHRCWRRRVTFSQLKAGLIADRDDMNRHCEMVPKCMGKYAIIGRRAMAGFLIMQKNPRTGNWRMRASRLTPQGAKIWCYQNSGMK